MPQEMDSGHYVNFCNERQLNQPDEEEPYYMNAMTNLPEYMNG